MIVDGLLILAGIGAVYSGYQRGFLQTIFSTIGYIGGGVLGLSVGLNFTAKIHSSVNKILLVIVAIFILAEIGRRLLGSIAKFFRARLLWSPFRFIDSIAGVALEFVRVALFAYLMISIALWSPWSYARHAVSQSKIYPEMAKQMPHIVNQLRKEIEKKLGTIPQLSSFSSQPK